MIVASMSRARSVLSAGLLAAAVGVTVPASVAAAAEATGANCGPITVTTPRALRVKTHVAGCWWDENDLGHSVIVTVKITGPNGFSKHLTKFQYGIPIGGPLAAQPVYSGKPALKVPRKGRYTIVVKEYYPYRLVPATAVSRKSIHVAGAS